MTPPQSSSRLQAVLEAGHFAVTAELTPPKNPVAGPLTKKARLVADYVDAVNLTDCQTAVVRASSMACSMVVQKEGVEPVMQMTCRDRNLIGLQSDLLGASALGIRNLLCLSGDSPRIGDHPDATPVFDVNSFQLLQLVRDMKHKRLLASGHELKVGTNFFIGAAYNPMSKNLVSMVKRLSKKVEMGAEFVQTQMIFDVPTFESLMEAVRADGLHQQVHILAGVAPLKSVRMAEYMNAHVPGIQVPESLIERLRSVDNGDPARVLQEGVDICLEVVEKIRAIEGVAGIHIMAVFCEETVPEIVQRAGLFPRPDVTWDQA